MWHKKGRILLVAAMVVLVALYVIGSIFSPQAKDRTFREVVIALDTAAVSTITIEPSVLQHEPVVLKRTSPGWSVSYSDRTHSADASRVRGLLSDLADLRTERLVGNIEHVKERYELTDSLVDRLRFYMHDGSTIAMEVGKGAAASGGNDGTSVVRLLSEDEVYAVASNMEVLIDQPADQWRPRDLVTGEAEDVVRMEFTFANDTNYVLWRDSDGWHVNDQRASSIRCNDFAESLVRSKAQRFADDIDSKDLQYPSHGLHVEFASGKPPIDVKVYPIPQQHGFVVVSSLDPDRVMHFDAYRELARMFRTWDAFKD